MQVRRHTGQRLAALVSLSVLGAAALAGCTPASGSASGGVQSDDATSASPSPATSAASLKVNVAARAQVPVDRVVKVSAADGSISDVTLTSADGTSTIKGTLNADSTVWTATQRLEPGTRYKVVGVAADENGLTTKVQRPFHTEALTLDQQTFPSIAPLNNETVGVGMPVIVTFDIGVTDRAAIERHLSVDTKPVQAGSWHWISDNEVHWRPKTYWKAGTDVVVHADINSVAAGNGIYGQESRVSRFHVGNAVIMKTNIAAHTMKVFQNGKLLRTLPVTGGDPGHLTRSGIKVIIEKFRSKRMDAATTGVPVGSPDYYNIANVEYAQRVTYSGEFIHAAPWSVGSQGSANVSHGCVGMSTSNAAWLYSITKRGDVVDVTGTPRRMEPTNGYGDWNLSWRDYQAGSALH